MPLLSLPPELILGIAQNLPARDQLQLIRCNRHLHSLLCPLLNTLDKKHTNGTRQIFHHIKRGVTTAEFLDILNDHTLNPAATSEFTDLTALHVAIYYQRSELTKFLLEVSKLDVDARDDYGYTALHVAASEGYSEGVEILLERGADIDARGGGVRSQKLKKWSKLRKKYLKGAAFMGIYEEIFWPEWC